ncbi:MAG: hypothetical protein A2Y17_13080 [Clostridiales bacterium GWF2_38_85]|nr:MAG: hypothetical protein A2Y17_13080 [Clostridiales bacterium GWF2_38_85]
MRKLIIFLLLLGCSVLIIFASTEVFYYHNEVLTPDDFGFGNVEVKENEVSFEVYIFPDKKYYYSKYDVDINDGIMTIKIYGSYKNKTKLEKDETGNIYLTVPIDCEITEIKHVTNDKTYSLWKKENEE